MGIWVASTVGVLGMGASVSIRMQIFVWTCTVILLGRRFCDVKNLSPHREAAGHVEASWAGTEATFVS